MRAHNLLLLLISFLFIFSACNEITDSGVTETNIWLEDTRTKGEEMRGASGEEDTILDIAAANEDFTILVQAVEFAGLTEKLNDRRQLTVFAPTDDAFVQLLDNLGLSAEELFVDDNKQLVKNILLYHIARGSRDAEEVTDSDKIKSLLKRYIEVQEQDGAFLVGNDENGFAEIIATDIFASNGVIHVINSVMQPPSKKNDDDDDDDEGDDDDDGDDRDDDSDDEDDRGNQDTILDIASSNEDFSTLTAAVEFAGLDGALDGKRKFTVFAPNNDAFAALLDQLGLTAEELFVEENKELVKNILLYHVAPGSRDAEEVTDSDKINTLLKKFVQVQQENGDFFVGNEENGFAQIIATDIFASNGVIHVINGVMLPPTSDDRDDDREDDDDDEDDDEEDDDDDDDDDEDDDNDDD